jgi:hypothetical protein
MRIGISTMPEWKSSLGTRNIARFDVEKAFSCEMEAVHRRTVRTYICQDRTGNCAPVIVQRVNRSSIERWMCDKCNMMVQPMISIWTEGDQTEYRDADGDHKNISQDREDTKVRVRVGLNGSESQMEKRGVRIRLGKCRADE